jgi:hypothetical protein
MALEPHLNRTGLQDVNAAQMWTSTLLLWEDHFWTIFFAEVNNFVGI